MPHNALLILHEYHEKVGTIRDHVDAIIGCKAANVVKSDCSIADQVNLSKFDIVIFHYSLVVALPSYVSPKLRRNIAAFKGLKILFIQDEYRWIDKTADAIRELGIRVVFSLCNANIVRKVYHHPWCDAVRFEYTLTGFASDELCRLPVPAYSDRRLDVTYRARRLNSWMGYHTIQKWQIADRFLVDSNRFGLKVDISTREQDRLYGSKWIELVSDARAVLGTESGASVCDFTGDIQVKAEAYLQRKPDATYEELKEKFFADVDGKITMNVISPRCFEAAALRTLMIMYPGEYAGILIPSKHYVVLQPDHSNIEDVLAILRSPDKAMAIIDAAYDDIAKSGLWRLSALSAHLDRVINEEMNALAAPRTKLAAITGTPDSFKAARREVERVKRNAAISPMVKLRKFTNNLVLVAADAIDRLPQPLRRTVRPLAAWSYHRTKQLVRSVLPGSN